MSFSKSKYNIIQRLLILLLCSIIIITLFQFNKKREFFDTTGSKSMVVLQSSLWNFSKWTNLHTNWEVGSFNTKSWESIITNVTSNKINNILPSSNTSALLLCDPLMKDIYFKSIPEYIVTKSQNPVPEGYFIGIIRPDKVNTIDCSYNFENKTIGYLDKSDYYFIQSIIQSYRLNPALIKLEQLETSNIQDLERIVNTTYIDIIITYIIPTSLAVDYIQSQRVGIIGFSTLDFTRVKLFYPYVSPQRVSLKALFANSSKSKVQILDKNTITILPKMTMKLLNISAMESSETVREPFITRLSIDPTSLDPNYRCYGDMVVESKAQCDSINDIDGIPKDFPTQWDKPCTSNVECPFYKKNKFYKNERGKCLENGYCEMPIGVLQSSPHIHYETGRFQPFCYGCNPGNDPDCCKITNDYAFPNDTNDRIAAGLKTSISLM